MKLRIVEYRLDLHQPLGHQRGDASSASIADLTDPLARNDPGITDGWQPASGEESLNVRGRMFYDVVSFEQVDVDSSPEQVPGQSFELEFANGDSFTVHNAIVVETQAEAVPA